MKLYLGIAIGVVLCTAFPEQTNSVTEWIRLHINDLAQYIADSTSDSYLKRFGD